MKTKAELVKRWGDILQETIARIPELHKLYNDPERNKKYDFNSALHSDYRVLAVLSYLFDHNPISFKENLRKAVPFKMELLKKYNEGLPIHPSRVSMTRFEELFDALASGDMVLAQEYASYMGGRSEVEEEYDDEFVLSLGYALKYAVENNLEALKSWLPRLKVFCEDPKNRMSEFMGYPLVLEALLERNLEKANAAFQVLLKGHKKKCQSRKGPDYGYYFYDSPDADLFVWGIGLANLCLFYGLGVQPADPLIPEELLISAVDKQPPVIIKHQSLTSDFQEMAHIKSEEQTEGTFEFFSLFHIDLLLNDQSFTLRFPVFSGWTSDTEAERESQCFAVLVPATKQFDNTDVFISIQLGFNRDYQGLSEEAILKELESFFIEDGWVKDVYLSSLRTYDNRIVSVLTYEDRELEYIRKELLLPLKEDDTKLLIIGFQVNHLDKKQAEALFLAMEALVKGCKLTEQLRDLEENQQYALDLASKGFAEYFKAR